MLNIAVVSFYTPNYNIGKYTKYINKAYCKCNNYDYFCFHKIPDELKNRHPSWCKIYYLIEKMNNNHYDYVMWIDADAFFCNKQIKIEDWIEKASNNIIISRDPGYSYEAFLKNKEGKLNYGIMIFKNNNINKKLLNYILYDSFFQENGSSNQAAIRHCYLHNIHDMKKNTWVNLDTNFNNNCHNVDEYIKNNGYIIHLTNFMGKFKGKSILKIRDFIMGNGKRIKNINMPLITLLRLKKKHF